MDAMDAVLRNFKLIPCPAGDGCTKRDCQWQHSWDIKSPTGPELDGSQDEDGPRKRRKLSSEPGSTPAKSLATNLEPFSALRPVSPPPLKRKLPQPTSNTAPVVTLPEPLPSSAASSTPTAKSSRDITSPDVTPHQTTPVKATPAKATPAKATPVNPTPRKPEALNPRHLKSAPTGHDFRYKALKLLHEQFQRLNNELKKDANEDEEKLVLSDQELIWLALDEEQRIATDKPSIYQNVIKNRIMAYKRMTPAQWKSEREAEHKKKSASTSSGSSTPGSKKVARAVLGPPKEVETGLTPEQEVEFLAHLYTPIDALSKYNYVSIAPSDEEIARAREGDEASGGWEVCDRCSTRFQVFPGRREEDGALTSGGKCVHHPGRPYLPERIPGVFNRPAKRYRCCQEVVGESPGCVTGDTHVFKTTSPARLSALIPFVRTPPNPSVPKGRAVCFDCEMGYTVYGLELIRLTATSWPDGKELLDILVQPLGEILDLNSRYSGVWPEDIVNAEPWSGEASSSEGQANTQKEEEATKEAERTKRKRMRIVPSPVAARDLLFSLISPTTPLIGHGLENDLNAVRIIHPTVIDTILLYPHKGGLPMRHGLKMLMETRLNKAIQVEEVDGKAMGHDSAEDARAAGELVRLKVQEKWSDMKREGWRIVHGKFVPPGGESKGSSEEAVVEEGEAPS
ncbi:hypothetical protein C8A03DRAFT_37738 [Achaetomium macrosporum]|uniref:Exonuclease domain-containing protein n=1 Tax=Achaetomium macrosporum TaxID=79813 RepID=A0AAN7C4A0_9PEZI|nr:hypothetical protein C8A03DRAFT_37738 [Achaetomium macrosporum]